MSWKFNPFTGTLDRVGAGSTSVSVDNFSYKKIESFQSVTIEENQQMIVNGHVTVLGHLSVFGDLVDISNRNGEEFFYKTIAADKVVEVSVDRLLLYKNHLSVLGHLRVNGYLEAS